MAKQNLKNKLKNIKLLVMDVDGVLTNGKINIDHEGNEIKVFDVQDGMGLALLKKFKIKTAIISARSAPAVSARAADLRIDIVYQDAYPKIDAFNKILTDLNFKKDEVCFMGDDWPDLCLIRAAGFSVAVNNACDEIKKQADYVTKRCGGDGAVREVIDLILKAQGKWKEIIKFYEG